MVSSEHREKVEKNTVYFLSDLHLGAPYFPDSHKSERRVVDFLDSIKDKAKTLFLVGDILDYWYEYRYVVPKGFVRFFGRLAEMSDNGTEIIWLLGNHDIWLFDYFQSELGIQVEDGPIIREVFGKKLMISHGDGLGKVPLTFSILRTLFRSKICQRLYSMINPRWTIPFAQNWSRSSRGNGNRNREKIDVEKYVEEIREFTIGYLKAHPEVEACIYGHFHLPLIQELPEGKKMIILGDWITHFTYGEMQEGREIEIKKFQWDKD